ncbi:MAG: hypothetical protein ROZ00_04905 [Denitratisoma sp.]|nr:hypothetical protein [Denitratisoma sp.]
MQHRTHTPLTWIATLRGCIEEWRRDNGWSRETAADMIVQAHERIGGPRATGIVFDPPTRDTFERMRVNADRIFRWLDDVTKDRNHLEANFIPSILAALPEGLRLHALDEMLRPFGIACRTVGGDAAIGDVGPLFRAMLTEGAQAEVAAADLLDGASHEELRIAQREIAEDIAARSRMLEAVESALAAGAKP